jgi:hypothetical protein
MAEANRSIPYTAAVITTARLGAISAVKQEFRAQGIKITHMAQGEIIAATNDYLRDHPELLDQAEDTICKLTGRSRSLKWYPPSEPPMRSMGELLAITSDQGR